MCVFILLTSRDALHTFFTRLYIARTGRSVVHVTCYIESFKTANIYSVWIRICQLYFSRNIMGKVCINGFEKHVGKYMFFLLQSKSNFSVQMEWENKTRLQVATTGSYSLYIVINQSTGCITIQKGLTPPEFHNLFHCNDYTILFQYLIFSTTFINSSLLSTPSPCY